MHSLALFSSFGNDRFQYCVKRFRKERLCLVSKNNLRENVKKRKYKRKKIRKIKIVKFNILFLFDISNTFYLILTS